MAIAISAAYVTHANGVPKPTVPIVEGRVEADAVNAIQAAGYVAEVQYVDSDGTPSGVVASMDPSGAAEMEPGATVVLVVSRGPRLVEVPNFAPIKVEDAEASGASAELEVNVAVEYSDSVPAGEFLSQGTAPGAWVVHDSTVDVVYSAGPEGLEIPNVVKMLKADAIAALEAVGLQVKVAKTSSDSVAKGKVAKQSPQAGADGHRTDTVKIWVSTGPAPQATSSYTSRDAMYAMHGMTESQARSYAKAHNIVLTVKHPAAHVSGYKGKVFTSTCDATTPIKCTVEISL